MVLRRSNGIADFQFHGGERKIDIADELYHRANQATETADKLNQNQSAGIQLQQGREEQTDDQAGGQKHADGSEYDGHTQESCAVDEDSQLFSISMRIFR